MSEQDRRRHQRYSLRLTTRVQRGSEQLKADIVNASASGWRGAVRSRGRTAR